MADECSCPRARDIDRHEADLRELREELRGDYVRKDVHRAERDAALARVGRLEDADTSEKAGNRSWLLGLAQMVLGAALGVVAAYLTAKGGK